MEYHATSEFPALLDNILCGEVYMKLARSGKIKKYDTVVMLSINGTQLYDNKQSDTWIYIWILVSGPLFP